jgi:hypothetical protein
MTLCLPLNCDNNLLIKHMGFKLLEFIALQIQVCERNYQPVDEVTVCEFAHCFNMIC